MTKEKKPTKPLTASQYTTRFRTLNKQYHARVDALAQQALEGIVAPFCRQHNLSFRVDDDEWYTFLSAQGTNVVWDRTPAPDGYTDVYIVLQTPVFDGTRLFQHMSDYTP